LSAGLGAAREAFAAMPRTLLGAVSWFAVFGAGSVLLAVLPRAKHAVDGEALSAAAFWSAGLGPAALVVGLWLAATAWGLLRRAPWSRWTAVLAYAVLAAAQVAVDGGAGAPRQAGLAAAWALAAWLYLFRSRGAVAYLGVDRGPA
jgi:hypothetical protein